MGDGGRGSSGEGCVAAVFGRYLGRCAAAARIVTVSAIGERDERARRTGESWVEGGGCFGCRVVDVVEVKVRCSRHWCGSGQGRQVRQGGGIPAYPVRSSGGAQMEPRTHSRAGLGFGQGRSHVLTVERVGHRSSSRQVQPRWRGLGGARTGSEVPLLLHWDVSSATARRRRRKKRWIYSGTVRLGVWMFSFAVSDYEVPMRVDFSISRDLVRVGRILRRIKE